jgi:1,2-diacylglycerol 3-beta-glucosyltransferase
MSEVSMSQSPRLLIVEDEAIVAEDLSHKVTNLGYQVVGLVPTGEEASSSSISN